MITSLKGASEDNRQERNYQGIKGGSDTARIALGEDGLVEEYEKNVDEKLIEEIVTVSLHLNAAMFKKYKATIMQKQTSNPVALEALRLDIQKAERVIAIWTPRLADMTRNATLYLRASSFCNKEILGPKFFKTQLESLEIDEFLTSICAIRQKAVVNKFFANYDKEKHQYADSYIYDSIFKLDLKIRRSHV